MRTAVHNRLAAQLKGDAAAAGKYGGAQKCAACHPKNFERWSATKHATALESLKGEDARNHECLSCHVTGFKEYLRREDTEFMNRMKGVQCESCHGPSGGHPPVASVRTPVAAVCIRCHNIERDPKFSYASYLERASCSSGKDK